MPKSPRSSGPGPKVPSKKLLGSGSKSKNRTTPKTAGGTTPPNVNMLQPHKSGNPDEVQRRAAATTTGMMLHKQLKKNKSTGIKPS